MGTVSVSLMGSGHLAGADLNHMRVLTLCLVSTIKALSLVSSQTPSQPPGLRSLLDGRLRSDRGCDGDGAPCGHSPRPGLRVEGAYRPIQGLSDSWQDMEPFHRVP